MTDNATHAILFELQKNLEDLSSAKVQMEEFRKTSQKVVDGVNTINKNYEEHLESLKSDFQTQVEHVQSQLAAFSENLTEENKETISTLVSFSKETMTGGLRKFKDIGEQIAKIQGEHKTSITQLLEQYKDVVEASNSLIATLNAIDFPSKLDALTSKSQVIIETVTNARQALELKSNESQSAVIDKIASEMKVNKDEIQSRIEAMQNEHKQQAEALLKELRFQKTLSYALMALVVIGMILSFVLLK